MEGAAPDEAVATDTSIPTTIEFNPGQVVFLGFLECYSLYENRIVSAKPSVLSRREFGLRVLRK